MNGEHAETKEKMISEAGFKTARWRIEQPKGFASATVGGGGAAETWQPRFGAEGSAETLALAAEALALAVETWQPCFGAEGSAETLALAAETLAFA